MKFFANLFVTAAISLAPYIVKRLKSKDDVEKTFSNNVTKSAHTEKKSNVPDNRFHASPELIAALSEKAESKEDLILLLQTIAKLENA